MRHYFILVFLCLLSFSAKALEADQYTIWKTKALQVEDSTSEVNAFMNQRLQAFLQKKVLDRKSFNQADRCEDISYKFMKHMRPHFFKSRLKTFLVDDSNNAAFPKKQKLFKDYKNSMYKGFAWPFLMPVAQTVKLNQVYLGTDKLDHFFSSGRRYLRSYRRARRKGVSYKQAIYKAIKYGTTWPEEKGVLGLWSAGAISFADLEANYQGMMFGLDICESDNPILKFDDQKQSWRQVREIRMQDYVNPLWDEGFNNSYYSGYRWKFVKKRMTEDFCKLGKDPKIQNIWKTYRKRLQRYKTSLNVEFLRGLIIVGVLPNPKDQSLQTTCNYPKGLMAGPHFWDIPAIHFEDE